MVTANIKYTFSGHETFACRNLWLKKGYDYVNSFKKFKDEDHSIDIILSYNNQMPLEILYHGTSEKSIESILLTGLEKRNRHHVHLSIDIETAIKVGQRHGKPQIFLVLAHQMFKDKFEFFISDNGVWLTNNVPAKYLKLYFE